MGNMHGIVRDMSVALIWVTFPLPCKLDGARLVAEPASGPPVRVPVFQEDCAVCHRVSVLAHALEPLMERDPSSPPSPQGASHQGAPWEWQVSCSHPTPSALGREKIPVI